MSEPVPISDPRPQRALHRAHRALEGELRAFLSPERADSILESALEIVVQGDFEDPARRLRAIVGAELLDEVADMLTRVGERIRTDETPTVIQALDPAPEPIRLDRAIDDRTGRSRIARRWRPETAVSRRVVG